MPRLANMRHKAVATTLLPTSDPVPKTARQRAFFILVTAYMNKNWIWEKGNPYPPDYVMEKITSKYMAAFLDTVLF